MDFHQKQNEKISCKIFSQREVSTLSWVGRPLKGDGGTQEERRRGDKRGEEGIFNDQIWARVDHPAQSSAVNIISDPAASRFPLIGRD